MLARFVLVAVLFFAVSWLIHKIMKPSGIGHAATSDAVPEVAGDNTPEVPQVPQGAPQVHPVHPVPQAPVPAAEEPEDLEPKYEGEEEDGHGEDASLLK